MNERKLYNWGLRKKDLNKILRFCKDLCGLYEGLTILFIMFFFMIPFLLIKGFILDIIFFYNPLKNTYHRVYSMIMGIKGYGAHQFLYEFDYGDMEYGCAVSNIIYAKDNNEAQKKLDKYVKSIEKMIK